MVVFGPIILSVPPLEYLFPVYFVLEKGMGIWYTLCYNLVTFPSLYFCFNCCPILCKEPHRGWTQFFVISERGATFSMKRIFLKTITLSLTLVLALGILGGCGKQEDVDIHAVVDTAVKTALSAEESPVSVVIEVDGRQITIEDAAGKSIPQLLEQAKITLAEGDVLSYDPYQVIGSPTVIRVLHTHHVTLTIVSEDPAQNVTHRLYLLGGTVADAMQAVGLQLDAGQVTNHRLDAALTDQMEILVTNVSTVADAKASLSQEDSLEEELSETAPSGEDASQEESTPSGRYEVSRDTYYDCDGSGHGVIVITYSDGTQEEVYF